MTLVFSNRSNRVREGIAEYERALALDPNLAGAHAQIGLAKARLGRPEETEGHVLEALRLSPRDTAAFGWMSFVGNAKLMLRATDEALVWFRRSVEINSAYGVSHMQLAIALAELGRLEEARAEATAALSFAPHISVRRYASMLAPTDNPALLKRREEIYGLLRVAGVPEE